MTTMEASSTEAGSEVIAEVSRFLFEESAALDEQRYDDWFAMLDDDFDYRVPVPMAREDPRLPRYSDTSVLAWESRGSLDHRFRRYKSEFAWADRPPAFVRHFVSNVRASSGERPGEWMVKSNLFVVRSRMPEPVSMVSAGREDLLRGSPETGFKLARRIVYLDAEQPTASQLAVLY
jgi:3-phenylpropionate/cinnamic acid dioxygenase small subunit